MISDNQITKTIIGKGFIHCTPRVDKCYIIKLHRILGTLTKKNQNIYDSFDYMDAEIALSKLSSEEKDRIVIDDYCVLDNYNNEIYNISIAYDKIKEVLRNTLFDWKYTDYHIYNKIKDK